MKLSWCVAGLALVCATASAQTQQQQQQTPPANQPPAQTQTHQQTPVKPAQTQPGTQAGHANSTPVPDSAKVQPPEEPIKGTVIEEIVARVNNEIITNVDYERARKDASDQVKEVCKSCPPEELAKQQAELDKDVLRDLIDQSLLVQRADDLDIHVDSDVVKEEDEIRQQNNLPDLEALQKAVETEGIDWDEFKNNIKKHILVQEVMRREIASKLNIDHAQIQAYYEAHKDQFERPEMVYLREILVSTKDKTDADLPKLKAKADELRQRVLENGDDFGELAKHFSDGSTAKQGGELGSFQPGQLKGEYAQVFQLNKNQMTPVIQTANGYEILQVQERYEAGVQPLDKVEGEIENKLTMDQMDPKKRAYCNQLRQDSYVWVHPGYTDTAGVGSTPIIEEETPVSQKKKDSDSGTASSSSQKKKKFLKIF